MHSRPSSPRSHAAGPLRFPVSTRSTWASVRPPGRPAASRSRCVSPRSRIELGTRSSCGRRFSAADLTRTGVRVIVRTRVRSSRHPRPRRSAPVGRAGAGFGRRLEAEPPHGAAGRDAVVDRRRAVRRGPARRRVEAAARERALRADDRCPANGCSSPSSRERRGMNRGDGLRAHPRAPPASRRRGEYTEIRELWKTHSLAEDNRDLPGLISTLTEDCVYEVMGTGARWEGHEGASRFYTELLTAFPDIHFDLEYIVIGPQGVCEEARVTATHRGPLARARADGRVARVAERDLLPVGRRGAEVQGRGRVHRPRLPEPRRAGETGLCPKERRIDTMQRPRSPRSSSIGAPCVLASCRSAALRDEPVLQALLVGFARGRASASGGRSRPGDVVRPTGTRRRPRG